MIKYFRLLIIGLLLAINPIQTEAQIVSVFAQGSFGGGSTSVIKSIQQVSITIPGSGISNTATISSVTTGNTMILINGATTTQTSASTYNRVAPRFALTNATTVTMSVNTTGSTVTGLATIVEFNSGVNSIQSGTITLSSQSSNTATISAVGANAFVLWLGGNSAAGSSPADVTIANSVQLTNSTTVTATLAGTGSAVIGYMVVDLNSTLVTAVQRMSHTYTSTTGTSWTDTITSVTTGNASLMYNGFTSNQGDTSVQQNWTRIALTNATTVTGNIGANNSNPNTVVTYYTVVSWAATALNQSIQRATINLHNQTSNTATITSVNTSKAAMNYLFETCDGAFTGNNPNGAMQSIVLTNGTTATASVNTSSGNQNNASVEIIEWK